MGFTMAQPEVSCHPETLVEGAQTVISAARCYYEPGSEADPDEGRLSRYTWSDAYASLRRSPRARPAARWGVSRVRRLERPRRPRGCRSCRRGVLREEHDGDHASVRVMGLFSARWSRTWRSNRRRATSSTADRAGSASTRVQQARLTSRVFSTRRSASRTGRKLRSRFPSITGPPWKAASTAATSARTCVRGIGGSRNGVASTSTPTWDRHRPYRCGTGSKVTGTGWSRSSIASTFRATTPAGFGEMRS